jgi:tetrahydromethanopterin S-methyltransferase subunit B
MYLNFFLGSSFGTVILVLLAFSILQWFHIPAGNFLDWVIGGASFWWLLVIVTVPWNVHFQAKQVLAEGVQSTEKGIPVDEKQLAYVKILAKRSLVIAIALHLLSAIALYILAVTGVSAVGYIGSGAALLLTALRPAVSAYEYLYARLSAIRQEWTYPREDVVELRNRVEILEATVKNLEEQLNPEKPYSLAANQQTYIEETRKELARISANVEELRATNHTEHERLSREARQAIAQLSTDGQFLDHVREIIRFFKTA